MVDALLREIQEFCTACRMHEAKAICGFTGSVNSIRSIQLLFTNTRRTDAMNCRLFSIRTMRGLCRCYKDSV